jgi:HD-like signal output (HDOD) protein
MTATTASDVAQPQMPVREIVRQITSISTLPEITTRIIRLVEDPASSAADLHQVIAHDPALVTRILKVVNSAFYGLPGQIAEVNRAIVLLGLNAVKNIAVAASLGQLFRGTRLCEGYTARDLWHHCVGVAIVSRELARQMRVPLQDEAFLAGLIHDVGILVSLQILPEKLREACRRAMEGVPFIDAERQAMGVDHQQLGQALCEYWRFPRSCQLVAGYHHRPAELADDSRLLVTLVSVADVLCCQHGEGFCLTARHQMLAETAHTQVGLDPAAVEMTQAALPLLLQDAVKYA